MVLNHVTQRYMERGRVGRYEFLKEVEQVNRILYEDLVGGGEIKRIGGEGVKDDIWLDTTPPWREGEEEEEEGEIEKLVEGVKVRIIRVPLWFYLPMVNGEIKNTDKGWRR